MRNLKKAVSGLVLFGLVGLATAAGLETVEIQPTGEGGLYVADGYVEAVRQSSIAAQVAGAIVALPVKAGDRVRQGQLLARIDERVAAQESTARRAELASADAELHAAQNEFERARRLRDKQYLSQVAFDQAEARYQAAVAKSQAAAAQSGAAQVEASFHALLSPYAGVLASVDVALGDMAAPGRPLMTLFDPDSMRVVATVPESIARDLDAARPVSVEIPGSGSAPIEVATRGVTVLPKADPATHTVEVRVALPRAAEPERRSPGMFARVGLRSRLAQGARWTLPSKAVVRRAEMSAVYVIDLAGKAMLRQVRVGRSFGDRIELLAGLEPAERVALDPLAAAAGIAK